jgi:anthranilate synthase component 1
LSSLLVDRNSSPVVREFVADALTPISAYLALATPGRSCCSSPSRGPTASRASRSSGSTTSKFVAFDNDPEMLDKIRAAIGASRSSDRPAAVSRRRGLRFHLRRRARARAHRPQAPGRRPVRDALVVVPGTWVVFDHFTHKVTLIGFATRGGRARRRSKRGSTATSRCCSGRGRRARNVRAQGRVVQSIALEASFSSASGRAKHAIYEGDVYQLQLGIRYSCELDGTPFDFYRQIRARNPSPYMFFIEHGAARCSVRRPSFSCGSTARGRACGRWRGRARAARRPSATNAIASELLANEKERAEHVMLVDLGRNDLGAVCDDGQRRVDELMVIERYSHVMHIVSNVTGELRADRDALDLFAAAFPGRHRDRARRRFGRCNSSTRSSRSRAASTPAASRTSISTATWIRASSLRSVATAGGRAYWQASAGIVADSDPQAEYDEIWPRRASCATSGARSMKRLLLVDNYDSFTYNLAHLFGALGAEVDVVRNDDALARGERPSPKPTRSASGPAPAVRAMPARRCRR